ncbi:virulence factor [Sphingomonas psychrolutea]|nr:virulence factor [Sphingomonas psychrolutea]
MSIGIGHNRADFRRASGGNSMYAIVFDLDVTMLEQMSPTPSRRNAYRDVGDILNRRGFERQQGSTYFGNERTTAVDCVLAVQELKRTYDLFQPSVSDIRMLRIEENNDLSPALE